MKSKIFTPLQIILTIAGITMIRTFIENFSNPEPFGGFTPLPLLINYFLFYSVVVITLGIIIAIITNQSWIKIISRTTYFLPIIWLGPIIDLLLSGGACMAYISTTGTTLLRDFIGFFGPFTTCGATIGIRVEILIIMMGTYWYVWKKTQSTWKAVLCALVSYVGIFFHAAIPGIIGTLAGTSVTPSMFFQSMFSESLLGSIHTLTNKIGEARFVEQLAFFMGRIPWIMIVLSIPFIAWNDVREKFHAWSGNLRITRIGYYALLMMAGTVVAINRAGITIPHTLPDILSYIIAIICICLSGWLGVVLNDIEDEALDIKNDNGRPLVTKTMTRDDMISVGWVTGTLLLTGALLVNWNFFIMIALWQIAYALYSLPPIKMKRHFTYSSLMVGIAGTASVLAGYFLVSPEQSFTSLPLGTVFAVWLSLAIISNGKDFKDVKGDRAEGIQTLPAKYGTRKAGLIFNLSIVIWAIIAAILFHHWTITLLAIPWLVINLILKKKIPEYVWFIILFAVIITVLIILK